MNFKCGSVITYSLTGAGFSVDQTDIYFGTTATPVSGRLRLSRRFAKRTMEQWTLTSPHGVEDCAVLSCHAGGWRFFVFPMIGKSICDALLLSLKSAIVCVFGIRL